MSIFKESFKTFVKNQIEIRQDKVSSNDRTYSLQRQCTIRMASGVDIDGSYTLASNNVLQGGTLSPTSVEATQTTNETNTPEFALKNRGGFDGAYDSPSDGFGYVPMPGITSVNIKTKTAYGSLRGATVNFECHNLSQLSILEQLYMRPGYPCLLEWGWLPFIDNDGDQQTRMNFLSDDGEFFNVKGNPNHFIKGTGAVNIQDALQKRIKDKKEKYAANYDGLFGIVKNFNYSVRPDGGFTCMTELVALGEVLDSLKGVLSEEDPTKHHLENILLKFNDYATAIVRGDTKDEAYITRNALGEQRVREAETLEKYFENKKIDLITFNENPQYDKNGADNYINWKTLTKIINDSINRDDDDTSLIEIITTDSDNKELEFNENKLSDNIKNILLTTGYDFPSKLDISVNPKVCLFPSQLYDIFGDEHEVGDNNSLNINVGGSSTVGNSLNTSKNIKDIYFNTNYLYKVFKSQFYSKDENDNEIVNEDFSIGKYIKTIWDDVNLASGNGHNFQLITEFDNGRKCKIIDLEIKETPPLPNLVEVSTLSTDSIVRDFNYDLTVPSSLTSTIAIAAQNPDSPGDLNQVTFAAFNKNIRNRFITNNGINNTKSSLVSRKKSYTHLTVINTNSPNNQNTINVGTTVNYLKDEVYTLNDLLIELKIYLERLKGYQYTKIETAFDQEGFVEGVSFLLSGDGTKQYIIETPLLKKAKNWNNSEDLALENNKDYNPQKWKLAGDTFIDFDEIPSATITSARTSLKKILTIKNNLSKYNLPSRAEIHSGITDKTTSKPDITSIIPIKFNMKLDGISGMVIGNVFKLNKSRLPKSYNNAKIAFVVFGEEQTIDNQDWTTTITGQVILLP